MPHRKSCNIFGMTPQNPVPLHLCCRDNACTIGGFVTWHLESLEGGSKNEEGGDDENGFGAARETDDFGEGGRRTPRKRTCPQWFWEGDNVWQQYLFRWIESSTPKVDGFSFRELSHRGCMNMEQGGESDNFAIATCWNVLSKYQKSAWCQFLSSLLVEFRNRIVTLRHPHKALIKAPDLRSKNICNIIVNVANQCARYSITFGPCDDQWKVQSLYGQIQFSFLPPSSYSGFEGGVGNAAWD